MSTTTGRGVFVREHKITANNESAYYKREKLSKAQ